MKIQTPRDKLIEWLNRIEQETDTDGIPDDEITESYRVIMILMMF